MRSSTPSAAAALVLALLLMTALAAGLGDVRASTQEQAAPSGAPVTVAEDDVTYTLANGIVTAKVSKGSGDLVSLVYQGVETLEAKSGHPFGYWSHDARAAKQVRAITIDPKTNGGERAEVSVKGFSNGQPLGSGPGGAFVADVEIRYALGRGDAGVYTYSIFDHRPEYPASTLGEARFCAKLNADVFDWMSVDAKRNKLYPKESRENKYNYTAVQFDNLAFGWSSTTKNIGFWLVNPTIEYLSGGPTKVEFLCHRDTTPVAAPCVLNYWRSSHYGGATVEVASGEQWTKVIGPFLLYCNAGGDPKALWKDALAQAAKEGRKWPYDWVSGVDYPQRGQRGTVSGQLVLKDPLTPDAKTSRLLVGLAHPAYTSPAARPGGPRLINWQTDAKHYEFWTHGGDDGRFSIPNVRPGRYTLHAFADGVLGEFAQTDIQVEPGQTLDLGRLPWVPVRRGRQLWDVGIPNRSGKEFLKGDDYFHDGMPLQYAKLFPQDVRYIIGKSDFAKDWYFEHVPHSENPNARATPFSGGGNGRATPWSITFDLPHAPRGRATLRLAICGVGTRAIDVSVNDQPAGRVDRLVNDSTLGRNGISGIWFERELAFDAALMKAGANVLTLTVPAGPVTAGVIYDYVRLELDESAPPKVPGGD